MSSGSAFTPTAEVSGLGETFYGAGAVEAHIHETLAGRLARPQSTPHRGDPPRHGQPADGAIVDRSGVPRRLGGRYRALGHLRQGLRPAGPSDARRPLPGQAARLQHLRRLQVRPFDEHQAGLELEPWRDRRAVRGSRRLHDARRRTRREPARERHRGDEDLAVRSRGDREPGSLHLRRTAQGGALAVREDPKGRRRSRWRSWSSSTRSGTCRPPSRSPRRSSPTPRPGSRIRSA